MPVKIICFLLCGIFLCTTLASIVGAVIFAFEGFYTESENQLLVDTVHGNLRTAANIITRSAVSGKDYNEEYEYSAERTNLRYCLFDESKNTVATNCDADGEWIYYYWFEIKETENGPDAICVRSGEVPIKNTDGKWTFAIRFEEGFPVEDEYALFSFLVDIGYTLRYWIYAIGIGSLVLFIALLVVLMSVSARRPNSHELHPGYLNRVPFDIIFVVVIALFGAALGVLSECNSYELTIALAIVPLPLAYLFIGTCMSIAARIKQRSLLKNTVVWRVCALLFKCLSRLWRGAVTLLRSLPTVWRTVILLVVNFMLDFIILAMMADRASDELAVFLWLAKATVIFGLGIYAGLFMRKLQKGAQALADGDLAYTTDTKGMYWDFKKHGENLNRISEGMSVAVEERLQSERMKTELITNVSHDIKTPLTSIINYSNLIADNKCDCEQHNEYSEVLLRKSEHLKRLLDDLVEISKANTGNLEIEFSPCDAGVLLEQASGEYLQRCEAAGLELITSIPDGKIKIMADGRRMWRVFDNLLNNAVKYSLFGSRVYISLEKNNGMARYTFKNTSKELLNVTPKELVERFVRGDSSRSTEGNGLGLSIAQSLVELQNGTFDIEIDGDLFKATLAFPIVE